MRDDVRLREDDKTEREQSLEPFASRRIEAPEAGISFAAASWGKPNDWSIDQLGGAGNAAAAERMGAILSRLGVHDGYATGTIKRNARIIEPSVLTRAIQAGPNVLHCNPEEPADGVLLPIGSAGLTSTSGCPIFLSARQGETPVYAHAGRDCLINRPRVDPTDQSPMRDDDHENVCFSALKALRVTSGAEAAQVYVWIYWGVPPNLLQYSFDHPQYGNFNKRMYEYIARRWGEQCAFVLDGKLCVDLSQLVRKEFIEKGVPQDHIDLRDAYLKEEYMWTDCTANAPRNLIAVARQA